MEKKLFVLFLFLFLSGSLGFVSATTTGDITSIGFDISSKPYYTSEDPLISVASKNTGTESYSVYVKTTITAPDGSSYSYESDPSIFQVGFTLVANLLYTYPDTEGIGRYYITTELWRSIDWWPDERLDTSSSSFDVIFSKPSG